MSHEFRTPLNAMLGYTPMLLQGVAGQVSDAAAQAVCRASSRTARHLLTIINEILDISRIEAGRMPLQRHDVRASRISSTRCRSELEPIILRSKLTVAIAHAAASCRRSAQRSAEGEADPAEPAEQRAEVHASGRVTMSARVRCASAVGCSMAVTDTGIGIAPEDQERIFEDFRQLDNSPTRAYGGTGSACRSAGGWRRCSAAASTLESQVGKGSTFTLTTASEGNGDDKRTPSDQPLVLLVDDYPDAREMYTEYLQFSGFDVVEAGNGMEAHAEGASTRCRTSS